jgi:uncharacterized protein YjbK
LAGTNSRDFTSKEFFRIMEVAMVDNPNAGQKQQQELKEEELELKFRVTRSEDLDLLASALKAAHVATARQVNTFFDSDAFDLDKNKYTVRLRKENGVFELGAKSPETKGGGGIQTQKDEPKIKSLSADIAKAILAGSDDPLDVLIKVKGESGTLASIRKLLGKKRLRKIGSFVNYRETVSAPLPCVGNQKVEMDTSIFPGNIVHYEIELEIPLELKKCVQEVEAALKALLVHTGIPIKDDPPSKAMRFFKSVKGEAID